MQFGLSNQVESRNALSIMNEADLNAEIARRFAERPSEDSSYVPYNETEGLIEEVKNYDTGSIDCYEEGK